MTGLDAYVNAFVIGMDDIRAAPQIEYPGRDDAKPAGRKTSVNKASAAATISP